MEGYHLISRRISLFTRRTPRLVVGYQFTRRISLFTRRIPKLVLGYTRLLVGLAN